MTAQGFSQVELVQLDDLLALQVRNAHAEALIALQGAQLLSYRRQDDKPLVWLSEQAAFKRGQSVRGGIPVCWPWFGDLQRNPESVRRMVPSDSLQPAHGLVRGVDWQLTRVQENDEGCVLEFRYPAPRGLAPVWPHAVELTLAVQVGQNLRLALTTRNEGEAPLPLTQALHTYFALSHVDQTRIEGFDQCPYIDTLDNWSDRLQQGEIPIDRELDRIYRQVPAEVRIRDEGWQRRIHLRASASSSAVVWNPWIDKSQRLSQFAGDAWQRMLCIETANVMDDLVLLAPGGSRTLTMEIWSSPL